MKLFAKATMFYIEPVVKCKPEANSSNFPNLARLSDPLLTTALSLRKIDYSESFINEIAHIPGSSFLAHR